MSQFHALKNLESDTRQSIPYLMNVQSDLLKHFGTRIVIPLRLKQGAALTPSKYLNPEFKISGDIYILVTQMMIATPLEYLGSSVADFSSESHIITNAIDAVLSGI
jgi:toxin CcdB